MDSWLAQSSVEAQPAHSNALAGNSDGNHSRSGSNPTLALRIGFTSPDALGNRGHRSGKYAMRSRALWPVSEALLQVVSVIRTLTLALMKFSLHLLQQHDSEPRVNSPNEGKADRDQGLR